MASQSFTKDNDPKAVKIYTGRIIPIRWDSCAIATEFSLWTADGEYLLENKHSLIKLKKYKHKQVTIWGYEKINEYDELYLYIKKIKVFSKDDTIPDHSRFSTEEEVFEDFTVSPAILPENYSHYCVNNFIVKML